MDNLLPSFIRQDCPVPPGTLTYIYCRDSGGESQDRSVKQQLDLALDYCARFGLVVGNIYLDRAKLSSNADRREQLQDMLTTIRAERPPVHDRARRRDKHQKQP